MGKDRRERGMLNLNEHFSGSLIWAGLKNSGACTRYTKYEIRLGNLPLEQSC